MYPHWMQDLFSFSYHDGEENNVADAETNSRIEIEANIRERKLSSFQSLFIILLSLCLIPLLNQYKF